MNRRPVIGMTTGRRNEQGELVGNPNILRVLANLDCDAVVLNYDTTNLCELENIVLGLDGYIFPGGGDVDPSYYSAERIDACGAPCENWDKLEMALFPLLKARKLPILGICRGCQVVNVGFGGTLFQDLPSQKGVIHRQDDSKGRYSHMARLREGSVLREVVGQDAIFVNSYHHQAVNMPAPGFDISAVGEDGIIEAIESTGDFFVMGIQWHPEVIDTDPASKRIFAAFKNAVVKNMEDK